MEIEAIVGAMRPGTDRFVWDAPEVECRRERHRYANARYSLAIDVLIIERRQAPRSWRLMLTSEAWRDGASDLRSTKWLKLLGGRATDVVAWINKCRADVDPQITSRRA